MAKREPAIVWNLSDVEQKRRLMSQVQKLTGLHEVSIKPRKLTRTLNQNGYWWVAVVGPFTEWLREAYGDPGITAEQAHEMLKVQALGWDERLIESTGQTMRLIPRSHDLNTAEFGELIDKAAAWLAEFCNLVILPPELFYESKKESQ